MLKIGDFDWNENWPVKRFTYDKGKHYMEWNFYSELCRSNLVLLKLVVTVS